MVNPKTKKPLFKKKSDSFEKPNDIQLSHYSNSRASSSRLECFYYIAEIHFYAIKSEESGKKDPQVVSNKTYTKCN